MTVAGCSAAVAGDGEFAPFPGHLEHKVRPSASLKQGVLSGRLLGKGSALRGPGQRDAELHDGAQFRNLRMLKELRADSKLSTDSYEAWPKAEPSHVPLGLVRVLGRAAQAGRNKVEAGTCRPCVA